MKKIIRFLTLAVLLAAPWGGYFNQVQAQTLTVHDGTSNSEKVPFDGYNADAAQHNQMIYPATELAAMDGKSITQMVFYIDGSASNGSYTAATRLGTWTVSLGETDATTLSGLDNSTSLTQVYQGNFDCSTGTLTLVFDDGYVYHGGNLLVDLNHAAASWNRWYFLGETVTGASYTYNSQRNFLPKTTFSYETPASCAKPTALAAGSVTATGASLTWTDGGSGTAWTLQVATNNTFTEGLRTFDNLNTTTKSFDDLTALTTYYVRVKADCGGGDESDWSNAISFSTTAVATVIGDSWSDDFEGASCGWELVNGTITNKWAWGTAAANGGSKAIYISNDNGTSNVYSNGSAAMVYATKLLNFTDGKYQFTYDWKANGESDYDYLRVALVPASTTLTAGTSTPSGFGTSTLPTGWIALDGGSKLNLVTSWQNKNVVINLAAGNYYLVLAWRNDGTSGTQPPAAVDNVSITKMACPYDVTGLAESNITTTGATLTWTAGEATQWQVAYGTSSTFEGAATATVGAATYNMTLEPSTIYYARVRAYCGGSDYGVWSDPISFATACATIAADGYTQNFDSYTTGNNVLPVCWSYINTTTNSSYRGNPKVYNYSSRSASNCLYLYSYAYYSGGTTTYDPQPQYAILPEMTGLAGMQLTLWAKGSNSSSSFNVGIMTDPTDVSTFVSFASQNLTTSYQEFVFDIPAISGNYLAIKLDAASSSRTTNGVYIDDISIAAPPTCLKPSALTLETKTAHTATLTWTDGADEAAWQIAYGTSPTFDPNSVSPVDVTTKPYTLTGLDANTIYYAYIRANCGSGDFSAWSSSYANFTTYTGVRVPTGLAVDNATLSPYAATVTWTGDPANDLHNSYELFYSQSSTNPTNETVPIFTGINTESKLIAGLTPGTTYYVWVRDNCGADGISAWTSRVSFTTPEFCPAPTGVTVSSATAHGATISWTGTSDSYNVYVGKVTLNSDSYDFEDNAISPNFTNDATYAWTVTDADKHAGTYSVKSGGDDDQTSNLTLTVTLTDAATLTFWDKISSEEDYDYGYFLIDGVQKYSLSGVGSWTQRTYDLTAGNHTLVWRYTKDYSTYSGDDCYYVDDITITSMDVASWERYEAAASPYVLNDEDHIDAETDYAVKVVGVCESVESTHESAVVYFTTSADCDASNVAVNNVSFHGADVTWDGSSDAGYTVSYRTATAIDGINEEFATSSLPSGWENKSGLLSSVMSGTALGSTTQWNFGTSNSVFNSHARINIYGTSRYGWLITPATLLPASAVMSFDVALTAYNSAGAAATTGTDDRFVVLISTDNMATWTILREWNNSGSTYVYNNIATAGENVYIDLSAYATQNVRIAFYGESTVYNADNDLHIDNVAIGTPVAAGAWQSVVAPSSPVTIEDLEDGTTYEVKVSPICDPSIESNVAEFTTLALPTISVEANKWYAFSTPMHDAGQNYESVSHISNITTGTYDFLRYDEPTSTWQSQKSGTGHTGFTTLEPGRGYIYRRATDAVLKVDGVPNTGNIVVPITKAVDGWNLIGNPFMTPIQLNITYIDPSSTAALLPVTDANSSCGYKLSTAGVWNVVVFNTSSIAAGEAVLVKASTAGTLILRPTASKGASAAEEESGKGIVFSVSNDKFTDVAYAMFADGEGLPKIAHLNPEAPALSIGGYAVATLDENTERFPMSVSGQGKYTLALKENSADATYLHLIDRATGRDIDLLATPEYTFMANGQADRFEVRLMPGMDENGNVNFVYIDGTRLIVDGEGELQVFDVMGRQLGSAQVAGTATLDRSALGIVSAGVYVVRLGGNSQKIVVK